MKIQIKHFFTDLIFFAVIIAICGIIISFMWKAARAGYRRAIIEKLQNMNSQSQIHDSSVPSNISTSSNSSSDLLNQSNQVSSNINIFNTYKQREIISDYKNYEEYLKQQKQQQENQGQNSLVNDVKYKPLDLFEKPNIDNPEKFFSSTQPEVERRIPWTQDKIDAAQIPNSETCRKGITGTIYECGVPAANFYMYEGI